MIIDLIRAYSQQLEQQGLSRNRELRESSLNFSSNDYLALRNDPRLKQGFIEGFKSQPAGSGASMVVCGYHSIHKKLEKTVASALNVDDALLFNSGYNANLAVVALLAQLKLHILIDKEVHASIYDGINLAKAKFHRFKHNDHSAAASKLAAFPSEMFTIITEGIFSMSGQEANLKGLTETRTPLYVDESHSFGVLGPQGKGAVAALGLSQEQVPIRLFTFGKAMGCQAAVIAGNGEWISLLLQVARPYIYTTGLSPALSYGLLEGFKLILDADDRRKKLSANINYFQQKILSSNLDWRQSSTPIQQLKLGCPHRSLTYMRNLQEKGITCVAMREPTVKRKDTGLRVVLSAEHSFDDLDSLFKELKTIHETEC